MSLTDPNHDLSRLTSWHGVHPGMTRSEAVAVLRAAGVEVSDEEGYVLATADEWEMELITEMGGEERVRQVTLNDPDFHWAGKPIFDVPLHEAMFAMVDAVRGAGWRAEDATEEFDDLKPPPPGPVSDATLLEEGTVWLPARGLGLRLCDGMMFDLAWRRSEDVPRQFTGPVTEQQMQLSKQPDLAEKLRAGRIAKANPRQPPPPWRPLPCLLSLLFLAALGTLVWHGLQEAKRWKTAQTITGKVVGFDTAPGSKATPLFRIEYPDPAGQLQTVVLEQNNFYATPRELGEEVQVCYAPGNPPQVIGPARVGDEALFIYLPRFVGLVVLYFALALLLHFLPQRKPAAREDGVKVI